MDSPMIAFEDVRQQLTEDVRRESRRVTALGILAVALGIFGLFYAGLMTITSVYVFGVALVISGLYHVFHAIKFRDGLGLLVDTPLGITQTIVGAILLSKPGASLLGLTLVTAAFLVISGLFQTVFSMAVKLPNWGWSLASGIVSIVLGIMVWTEWPVSALWVLGAFVSAYLVTTGMSFLMIGATARKAFPKPAAQPAG